MCRRVCTVVRPVLDGAERRALYVVAATFFLLAAYITFEAVNSLLGREEPDRSVRGWS